ncbi:hypothetical protein MMC31_005231, partial [Peltigera leucophlebia]|nr:hypothetical protein [Peltigera leucophlebia]
MSETRETVVMDITMLAKFAAVQRISRSRVGTNVSAFINLRHPAMPPLSRGFFDSKGNQKSEEILDAFATIFAGSEGYVA